MPSSLVNGKRRATSAIRPEFAHNRWTHPDQSVMHIPALPTSAWRSHADRRVSVRLSRGFPHRWQSWPRPPPGSGEVVFLCIASACVNFGFCREECTTSSDWSRAVVFDLARYGRRQSRMSVPGFDSMAGGTVFPSLYSAGCRVWPEAAAPSRRPHKSWRQLGSAGPAWTRRPGRRHRQRCGPASGPEDPRICSGRSLGFGLRAVRLPQLRTHSPHGAVDRRRPRLLIRFWSGKSASSASCLS